MMDSHEIWYTLCQILSPLDLMIFMVQINSSSVGTPKKGQEGFLYVTSTLVNQQPSYTLKHLTRPRDCIAIHKSLIVTSRASPSTTQQMNYTMCSCVNAFGVLKVRQA